MGVPRGLLADAEAGEDGVEDVFDPDGAGDAAEGAEGLTEIFGSEFRQGGVVGGGEAGGGFLEGGAVAGAGEGRRAG